MLFYVVILFFNEPTIYHIKRWRYVRYVKKTDDALVVLLLLLLLLLLLFVASFTMNPLTRVFDDMMSCMYVRKQTACDGHLHGKKESKLHVLDTYMVRKKANCMCWAST